MDDKDYQSKKREELFELKKGEQEIRKKLRSTNTLEDKYENYGLLDIDWLSKYKVYLNNYLNDKSKNRFNYNIKDICPKIKHKIFFISQNNIKRNYKYNLPINFVLVTEKFINLLSSNLNKKEKKIIKSMTFQAIIKGYCIIIKDGHSDIDHYITIYDENKGNSIDFIIRIYDEEEMKKNIDLILNNDFWYYLRYNTFSSKKECQKILNNKKTKTVGYFLLNCDEIRCHEIFNSNKLIEFDQRIISKINSFLMCLSLIQ
jgi:hypothetical protein